MEDLLPGPEPERIVFGLSVPPDFRNQNVGRQRDTADQKKNIERRSQRRISQHTHLSEQSEGDPAAANGRKALVTLPSQQPAERAAYQRAADRTANRAAHRFAEIGSQPADHPVGNRARDASRDNLTGRHPAARHVSAENRSDDRADLPQNSSASAASRSVRG